LALAYLLEVCLGCYGIAILIQEPAHSVTVLVATIAIFIDIWILFLVLSFLLLLSKGRKPKPMDSNSYTETARFLLWTMSLLCCRLFGTVDSPMGQHEVVWSEISRVVHSFLKNMLVDYTVSDMFAAFILVWSEQHDLEDVRVEKALSSAGLANSPRSPDFRYKSQTVASSTPVLSTDSAAIQALQDFERFSPLMLGIYGWKLNMYMNACSFAGRSPAYFLRKFWHGTAFDEHVFKHIAQIDGKKKKLLYSSWTSYMSEAIPYTVVVDHENKALVITMRGTMSVGDIATDLLCIPMKLGEIGKAWDAACGAPHPRGHREATDCSSLAQRAARKLGGH
jgi:hypothetical protein